MSENPYADIVPPPNKRGRKPGGKNRPKWLIEELKKFKRPRGRPRKGQENDLGNFLLESLKNTSDKPPSFRKPKAPKDPARVERARLLNAGSPEQRKLKSQRAEQAVKRKRGKLPGCPGTWTNKEYLLATEIAKNEAQRILKRMEKETEGSDLLPEDQLAKECLKAAYEIMRSPNKASDKLKAIKTILEFTKAKPATKSDVTVRTAEDFLDELMAKSGYEGS